MPMIVPTDEGPRRSWRGYNNGSADVLRVETLEGLSLTGTPNHKVKAMTPTGLQWKQLSDLVPGDSIAVKLNAYTGPKHPHRLKHPTVQHGNQINVELPELFDERFAFFLGYMAGNGFVASADDDYRIGVTVPHKSYLMAEMPEIMARLFNGANVLQMGKADSACTTFYISNKLVKEFLTINGLAKSKSITAAVPALIRQSSRAVVGSFLRGLFEADGGL